MIHIPDSKPKKIGQLRRTQLITTFGPGSIVEMPDYSVVISDASMWEYANHVLHEERLERLLDVKYFKEPLASEDQFYGEGVIKSFRFPRWHYCPNCHKLGPIWQLEGKKQGHCATCKENSRLIPSSFVVACENGHLEDFPYNWWVHRDNKKQCEGKALEIIFDKSTGGLEGISIRCKVCGARKSMTHAISADALKGFRCHGHRPWLGSRHDDPQECTEQVRMLQRGATNLYFPITISALTIPAFDLNPLAQFASDNWSTTSLVWSLLDSEDKKLQYCNNLLDKDGLLDQYTSQQLHQEFLKLETGNLFEERNLIEDEYMAISLLNKNEPAFKTEHIEPPAFFRKYISDVVLVKRLREVVALRGFRRITPAPSEEPSETEKEYESRVENSITPSTTAMDWLPAVELLGEGIFIKLNIEEVNKWAERVGDRYSSMAKHLERSTVKCSNFSSRFVLLHTLSHLLIRQLTFDCGYSSAAIKERIYSSKCTDDREMAGILLYTSSPDSDGSLGGLVRQGMPKNLQLTFENMLNAASWCSSDPICSQSKDQSFDALNYAACHACTLLPETSCAMRNSLLDRVSIVGTIDEPGLGFFKDWFKNEGTN